LAPIETQRKYLELVEELIEHDRHYYDETKPLISDFEYDQKMKALIEYEKKHPDAIAPNSPSQRIAEAPTEGFVQKKHLTPMISLANTYSEEEVAAFLERVYKLLGKRQIDFCAELKMDGTAISLQYKKGALVSALTRGNGQVGDDVTANIKTISSIPLHLSGSHLPELIEIRGEVYMSLATFTALNETREEEGLEPFANPRNAAAGSLKLLDPKEVAKRKLHAVCYGVSEGLSPCPTQSELHLQLKKWGLPIAKKEHLALCSDLKEIMQFAKKIHKEREHLPFEIDGIVIKVDELKYHKILGSTGKVPRFAIAYKFAPEQAETLIQDITVQVGRSGTLTPVAELKAVFLAGSTISRATLHNQDEIARKDIRIGDTVIIEKGGDVIPKVVQVDFAKRGPHSKVWHMPKQCPVCHTKVVHHPGEVAVRCPNAACPGQLLGRITYFASKHAMDIDHMGEKVAQQLVEKGFVKRPSDIYRLNEKQLSQLEGFKEKSIQNLLQSIDASRNCSLPRFIMGLGIPSVGEETAECLAEEARDLSTLLKMKKEEFLQIEGIGEKTAAILADFFQDASHRREIDLLLEHGVKPSRLKEKMKGHAFSDKTFVLTGALEQYSRDEAGALIKERGGHVSGSVSKNTDYVLVGEDPGSKYEKAKKLGIKILSEEQFKKML
jgi:DNA ligase (NAD+)